FSDPCLPSDGNTPECEGQESGFRRPEPGAKLVELPGIEPPNRLCCEFMARSSHDGLLTRLRVLAGVEEGLGQLEMPKRFGRIPGYHLTQSIRCKPILFFLFSRI